MESFHGDTAVKKKLLVQLNAHAKADEIVKGVYWEEGKGCAVGCTIHSGDHKAYEKLLGLPEWLARLEDRIFEGLPNDKAKKFPIDLIKAIPVGKNLDKVKWQFTAFVLKENVDRVMKLAITDELKKQVVDAIRQCLALQERAIKTGKWNESAAAAATAAAWSARSAATTAAWSTWSAEAAAAAAEAAAAAARSAATTAAWSAAWSAAAAESAAAAAARSAAAESAAAAWSARSAAYVRYSKELIRLLKAVK